VRYERIVRRLRQRIFDYPQEQQEKAERVLHKCVAHKVAQQQQGEDTYKRGVRQVLRAHTSLTELDFM
jgi:hypothetical protein